MDTGSPVSPPASESLRAANMAAGEQHAAPSAHQPGAPAQDRLLVKAQKIFDLVQTRGQHFQHELMADRAMDVMLSLFLAEFSEASDAGAAPQEAIAPPGQGEDDIIAALLEAGLIETVVDGARRGQIGLTPLGAGRMRSFISAYPDGL